MAGIDEREADTAPRRRITPARVAIAIVIAGLVLMWVLAFAGVGKPKRPLDDVAWTERAQKLCQGVMEDIEALPKAHTSATPAARAVVVDRGSDLLAGMVDELWRTAPKDPHDGPYVRRWIGEWRTYLGDRRDFSAALRTEGAKARFEVTAEGGAQITVNMDGFATANHMSSCSAPDDV
jgi:hypothetical protein